MNFYTLADWVLQKTGMCSVPSTYFLPVNAVFVLQKTHLDLVWLSQVSDQSLVPCLWNFQRAMLSTGLETQVVRLTIYLFI